MATQEVLVGLICICYVICAFYGLKFHARLLIYVRIKQVLFKVLPWFHLYNALVFEFCFCYCFAKIRVWFFSKAFGLEIVIISKKYWHLDCSISLWHCAWLCTDLAHSTCFCTKSAKLAVNVFLFQSSMQIIIKAFICEAHLNSKPHSK